MQPMQETVLDARFLLTASPATEPVTEPATKPATEPATMLATQAITTEPQSVYYFELANVMNHFCVVVRLHIVTKKKVSGPPLSGYLNPKH